MRRNDERHSMDKLKIAYWFGYTRGVHEANEGTLTEPPTFEGLLELLGEDGDGIDYSAELAKAEARRINAEANHIESVTQVPVQPENDIRILRLLNFHEIEPLWSNKRMWESIGSDITSIPEADRVLMEQAQTARREQLENNQPKMTKDKVMNAMKSGSVTL